MSLFKNFFSKASAPNNYKGTAFYVINKHTGDIVPEMGRGRTSSENDWDKIESFALQLSDKLRSKSAPFVPGWTIIAYPCDDVRTANLVSDNYDKVVSMIRSRKPTATIDLRIVFYASEYGYEYSSEKETYNWMDKNYDAWLANQEQIEKAELQKADIIFINSMLADQNTLSETELKKMRAIFLTNKDEIPFLESILSHMLNHASKHRRVQLFAHIESILTESDIYDDNQFNNLNDFLDMNTDKMKPIHILSAELLESTLEQQTTSPQSNTIAQTRKDLYQIRRFLYRYHKATNQLTDAEHVFEMEEQVDAVLACWRERMPQIQAELDAQQQQAIPHPPLPEVVLTTESAPIAIQPETEELPTTQPRTQQSPTQEDVNQSIATSIRLLEKGHRLREQIIRYASNPLITRAQLEWAATQKFITPMSLVEDGTLVNVIETSYFIENLGADLQYIDPDNTNTVSQLVCLAYDIFCRRELCNTSALLEDLKKQYTISRIKEDSELINRYTYLYLICDIRKRCYEAVSQKVSELKKREYEQKRENALDETEKMITILLQDNINPMLRTTAWDSVTRFLHSWQEDGISIQSFIQSLTDRSQTSNIGQLVGQLLCHLFHTQDEREALNTIIGRTYNKNQLTINDYLQLSLYHLHAVGYHQWLQAEDAQRKSWGAVFDKLNQKRMLWAEEYIAEPAKLLIRNQEDLPKREEAGQWAESIILYRFCEIDDIPFDQLYENFSFLPPEKEIENPGKEFPAVRKRSIWLDVPPEEDDKVRQAIQTVTSTTPLIDPPTDNSLFTEDQEEEEEDNNAAEEEEEYTRFPGGKGYILNGVRVFTKKDYQTISQAFSFVIWRQTKPEKQIQAYKQKLTDLKNKMEAESIQWPPTFLSIYNGIINK